MSNKRKGILAADANGLLRPDRNGTPRSARLVRPETQARYIEAGDHLATTLDNAVVKARGFLGRARGRRVSVRP